MKSGALAFWIGLAVVGSVAYGSWVVLKNKDDKPHADAPKQFAVASKQDPGSEKGPTIQEFQLTERSKLPFHSKEVAGQVWIASFFFSNCPTECWRLNQVLKTVQDDITDPGFRIVSISCDPEQDTPEVLQAYANRLGADRGRWLFLTGDLKYIQRIGKEVFFQEVAPGFHMNRAMLVDRQGKICGSFDLLDPEKVTEMKAEIRKLLAEQPAEGDSKTEPQKS